MRKSPRIRRQLFTELISLMKRSRIGQLIPVTILSGVIYMRISPVVALVMMALFLFIFYEDIFLDIQLLTSYLLVSFGWKDKYRSVSESLYFGDIPTSEPDLRLIRDRIGARAVLGILPDRLKEKSTIIGKPLDESRWSIENISFKSVIMKSNLSPTEFHDILAILDQLISSGKRVYCYSIPSDVCITILVGYLIKYERISSNEAIERLQVLKILDRSNGRNSPAIQRALKMLGTR